MALTIWSTNRTTPMRPTIDKAGCVGIPKPLCEEQLLEPVTLRYGNHGLTDYRSSRPSERTLTREHGGWVFRVGQPLSASTTDEVARRIRAEHDVVNLGSGEWKHSSTLLYL